MDGRETKSGLELLALPSLSKHSEMKRFLELELWIPAQFPPLRTIHTLTAELLTTSRFPQDFLPAMCVASAAWFSRRVWNIPENSTFLEVNRGTQQYLGEPWIYLQPHRGTGRSHTHPPGFRQCLEDLRAFHFVSHRKEFCLQQNLENIKQLLLPSSLSSIPAENESKWKH